MNGHCRNTGCRGFCPGKAILQHIKHCLFPERKTWKKRIKLFCRREWQDKQITSKRESLPWIMISPVQQLRCHPTSSDTQGMQVRGSWKRKVHNCGARGLWFHMSAVGVWIPTSKKQIKKPQQSCSFPPDQMIRVFCVASFFFSDQKLVVTINCTYISQEVVVPKWTLLFFLRWCFVWRVRALQLPLTGSPLSHASDHLICLKSFLLRGQC